MINFNKKTIEINCLLEYLKLLQNMSNDVCWKNEMDDFNRSISIVMLSLFECLWFHDGGQLVMMKRIDPIECETNLSSCNRNTSERHDTECWLCMSEFSKKVTMKCV